SAQERDETAANAGNRQVGVEVVALRNFAANNEGTVTPELLPSYIFPTVTLGGADIRTDDGTTYSITSSGAAATVNNSPSDANKGRITITAVDALSGWIDLVVTVNGV